MIKEKIAKLIDVKSIVTLILTIVVAYLSITNKMEIKEIFIMIMGFYFGTQSVKNKSNGEEK